MSVEIRRIRPDDWPGAGSPGLVDRCADWARQQGASELVQELEMALALTSS